MCACLVSKSETRTRRPITEEERVKRERAYYFERAREREREVLSKKREKLRRHWKSILEDKSSEPSRERNFVEIRRTLFVVELS